MAMKLFCRTSVLSAAALLTTLGLSACATANAPAPTAEAPKPEVPTEQYELAATQVPETIHLRINPNGMSDNQRRALDQVASQAGWAQGGTADVEILTAGDPASVAAGSRIADYLISRTVSRDSIFVRSLPDQPADIVTVTMVHYQANLYDCNRTWENMAATGGNRAYNNFGCALTSNLAAQVADPRDLAAPRALSPADAARRSVIFDKYRKGEVTSAARDDDASGAISQAIK
jgi:pilus assembly protein CpaD